jgi:hypothetical protein
MREKQKHVSALIIAVASGCTPGLKTTNQYVRLGDMPCRLESCSGEMVPATQFIWEPKKGELNVKG